jgi:hypothetical protein
MSCLKFGVLDGWEILEVYREAMERARGRRKEV